MQNGVALRVIQCAPPSYAEAMNETATREGKDRAPPAYDQHHSFSESSTPSDSQQDYFSDVYVQRSNFESQQTIPSIEPHTEIHEGSYCLKLSTLIVIMVIVTSIIKLFLMHS
ncbi:uncharacterized protein LOC143148765 [Ptiloglossa arizonensis]|uniref:uncharacterized protein LOC143148765 n=1 Tax=Ptiloglossa arizonensis TaxID=3350558 RepID=UPI003F9F2FD2